VGNRFSCREKFKMNNQISNGFIKNPKANWKYISIVLILAIVVGGGILGWRWMAEKEIEVPKEIKVPEEVKLPQKEEIEKPGISKETINKSLSICEKINDNTEKAVCIGIVNGDLEACEILKWKKEKCYILLGYRTGNSSICERLKYDLDQYDCLARVTEDYEKCKKGRTVTGDDCFYDIALKRRDSLGCGKITEESLRNRCFAFLEKNSDYCQKISEVIIRDSCYIILAMLTGDSSICQKLESTVYVSETLEERKKMCTLLAERNIENLDCERYVFCTNLAALTQDARYAKNMKI
jgi:hypothetical protein